MIRLYSVIDTRTGRFYSVAVVTPRNAQFFVAADGNEGDTE